MMKRWSLLLIFCGLSTLAWADEDLVKKGEYLARMGDCASCHTVNESKPFAGGNAIPTPFGVLYSTNLTPDETGIGGWRFEDFYRALHLGKNRQGQPYYPAFPYTSFTKVTQDDAKAIFAYLQAQKPIKQPNKNPKMDFPFSERVLLNGWRWLYFSEQEFQPDPKQSAQWNRGAYLVEGLGHCNECHSTRNALGAVKRSGWLAGGHIPMQGWYAPSLSMKDGGGLAGWTRAEVKQLLKTGFSAKGSVIGPMADVVRNSTQYMNDEDLEAVALYLESLPAAPVEPVHEQPKAADYAQGKAIYEDHCQDCHGQQGEGVAGIYPSLVHNQTVVGLDGVNAMRSVLLGGFPPATQGHPEPYSMPPFAKQLSNADIAAVVNYIRQSWGNNASAVQAEAVNQMRSKTLR